MSTNEKTAEKTADKITDDDAADQGPIGPSVKERLIESRGVNVSLDYFLYSALELERTMRATGRFADAGHWPEMGNAVPDLQPGATATNGDVLFAIQQMLQWYVETYPEISGSGPLDHERLSEMLRPFCLFANDIQVLYKSVLGRAVPRFGDDLDDQDFWTALKASYKLMFGTYGDLVEKYLQWHYGIERHIVDPPGSRPPVGKYAPRLSRFGSGDRGGRPERGGNGDRGGRGGGDRGGRPERGGNGGRSSGPRRDGPPRPGGGERDGNRPRGERDGNRGNEGNRDRGGPRPQQGGRNPRNFNEPRRDQGFKPEQRSPEETERLTSLALAAVEDALQQLRNHPDVNEVKLAPVNSFYRRFQHQMVVENGFASESIGEGNERAVKVLRQKA